MKNRINYIQIYGERNSGTNYLHFLLEHNIKNINVGYKYGWKHGFAKVEEMKQKINETDLIICLFKDPYSWLVSMHGKPHHAPQLVGKSFSEFIRSEWACYSGDNYDTRDLTKDPVTDAQEMLHERNPDTNKRFENVMQLRSAKIKRVKELQQFWPNILYMQYEELLQSPRVTVCNIAGKYKMRLNGPVQLSKGYFGKNPNKKWDRTAYYQEKQYLKHYTPEDLQYVNQNIDWNYENILGYHKIETLNAV